MTEYPKTRNALLYKTKVSQKWNWENREALKRAPLGYCYYYYHNDYCQWDNLILFDN